MQAGLVLITVFFVSLAWVIYIARLNKDARAAASQARQELDAALERARSAEGVANTLHDRILRAEAALNADTDLPSAAQAARIILYAATEPAPRTEPPPPAPAP